MALNLAIIFDTPTSFEILLIRQLNASYIATFKLVKKAAPTLPILLQNPHY